VLNSKTVMFANFSSTSRGALNYQGLHAQQYLTDLMNCILQHCLSVDMKLMPPTNPKVRYFFDTKPKLLNIDIIPSFCAYYPTTSAFGQRTGQIDHSVTEMPSYYETCYCYHIDYQLPCGYRYGCRFIYTAAFTVQTSIGVSMILGAG
jgi:hypothetical protein